MNMDDSPHQKYEELCALATTGCLSPAEREELQPHLAICGECRDVYEQCFSVTAQAIPVLAQDYAVSEDCISWDRKKAEARLFAEIHPPPVSSRNTVAWMVPLAACVTLAVGIIAYRAGSEAKAPPRNTPVVAVEPVHALQTPARNVEDTENVSLRRQLALSSVALEKLQAAGDSKQAEIDNLQTALTATEARLGEAAASDTGKTAQLQALVSERDSLAQQLRAAQEAYKTVQEDLTTLRDQRGRAVLRVASLESDVQKLTERLLEKDRALKDHEHYLASDRDIRELMGARQLYIADVFDVDKNGNKRKPFGRVFYTQQKSLIFYAFDLDQQPGIQNASAFQAWGQRDAKAEKPLNLGILYLDNEANRRWVLQFDDPAQLAQIDAVFVTVEPHGGSAKPSGKPLLYASLRKLPNHP